MTNPYENEIEAIKVLAAAHDSVLRTPRDIAAYSVSKLLVAIDALSETIVEKAKREGLPND